MSDTQINYDSLVENALRGVVRDILGHVAVDGLPGSHHFYIAFKTHASGVQIPDDLRQRYPDEMTIVLQHRFWGLTVHDDRFEVGLSFNQKSERLVIPFDAVIGFVDPSVQFALQFQDDSPAGEEAQSEQDTAAAPDPGAEQGEDSAEEHGDDQKVVTLDAFRKKP